MNGQAIGRLGVGLLGVWAFIEALLVFPRVATAAPFQYAVHGAWAAFIAMLLPFVLLLALSYVLVFHADAVARRVLAPLELEPAAAPPELGPVAVGLVGLFFVLMSLPGILQAMMVREGSQIAAGLRLRLGAASLAQAAVGLFMMLRPAILLGLWQPRHAAPPSGGAA